MTIRTQSHFLSRVKEGYLPRLIGLLEYKGRQYAGGDADALANFTDPAQVLGHTPAHHLMTLATKQWFVLCAWSNDGSIAEATKREIIQRIFDVLVYMLLLLFMLEGKAKDENDTHLFSQTN